MFYPLAVLLQATAVSVGMPAIFYVDMVLGLINSLFARHLSVDLRRFPAPSRNRYWVAAVANVGEGKSPASGPIVALLQEVLAQYPHLVPGTVSDRFHYQQNSTSACARDKLRACEGYLSVYSDEAGLCLSQKYAAGGDIDPFRHIDLGLFMNAAHGGEFDFATLRERLQVGSKKKAPHDPRGAVPEEEGLQLNPTNIHFLFLQQEYYFNHFWAQLAGDKPMGLAQRFLFSFGAYENPPLGSYSGFFQSVTAPVLKKLFELVLVRYGPKVVAARDLTFSINSKQERSVEQIHELVTALKRRESCVSQALRLAMPKSMYWLATALMTMHVLEHVWPWVSVPLLPTNPYVTEVTDSCFFSACRFLHRRFLRGHAILAVNADERSWLPQKIVQRSEEEAFFLRVLRGAPQRRLSVAECCACDLDFKRAWIAKESRVSQLLGRLWQLCVDVGLGSLSSLVGSSNMDPLQATLTKFPLTALHEQAKEWLRKHRVPLENWTFPADPVSVSCSLASASASAVSSSSLASAPPVPADIAKCNLQGAALVPSPSLDFSAPRPNLVSTTLRDSVSEPPSAVVVAAPVPAVGCVSAASLPSEPSRVAEASPPPVSVPLADSQRSESVPPVFLAACALGVPLKSRAEIKAHISGHPTCSSFRHRVLSSHSDLRKWTFRVVCAEDVDCGYVVLATYFLQSRGHAAGTLVFSSLRKHVHNTEVNSGKIFTPLQASVARAFLAEGGNVARQLSIHLQEKFPNTRLPNLTQLAGWLKREKQKANANARLASTENVVGTVSVTLESWYRIPDAVAGLYVLSRAVVVSDVETFIPFTCPGMLSVLSRYAAVDVLLALDSKQKVLDRGMGVLTVSVLAKTGLRNTRLTGTRQQIRACVTRAFPVLQAIIHAESSPNADRMFTLLSELWQESHGESRPPLRDCVKQVHKDYAPAFESARQKHFPLSRPCDDYFHLRQKYKELDARLSQTHVERGCFVKTHLGWLRACLHSLRLLPRLGLFHFCWQGLMNRLHQKQEPAVAEYLAKQYTQNVPECFVQSGHDREFWFASFWSGYEGVLPGTACGSEPAEALHADWQANLKSDGGRSSVASVFPVLQKLYARWSDFYDWNSSDTLSTCPVDIDPSHVHGTAAFTKAGRAAAAELWKAHTEDSPSYCVFDATDGMAFLAVRMSLASNALCRDTCRSVVELLHCDPSVMPSRLNALGILETSDIGFLFKLGAFKRIFDHIAFVRVLPESRRCSCSSFALWGGCEHEILSRGLTFRFVPASMSFADLPVQRKRGRPTGSKVVQGGSAAKRRRTSSYTLSFYCIDCVSGIC
eukprot:Skav208133  [mRNA]  locus=scaffold3170:20796:24740:- [translate_table: standard]